MTVSQSKIPEIAPAEQAENEINLRGEPASAEKAKIEGTNPPSAKQSTT